LLFYTLDELLANQKVKAKHIELKVSKLDFLLKTNLGHLGTKKEKNILLK